MSTAAAAAVAPTEARLQGGRPRFLASLVRFLTAADHSGPNCPKLPKIRFGKLVKLNAYTYACNNLTDFYMKIQSLETATMSNLLKLVWKSS